LRLEGRWRSPMAKRRMGGKRHCTGGEALVVEAVGKGPRLR
jgi:hypothetical protein